MKKMKKRLMAIILLLTMVSSLFANVAPASAAINERVNHSLGRNLPQGFEETSLDEENDFYYEDEEAFEGGYGQYSNIVGDYEEFLSYEWDYARDENILYLYMVNDAKYIFILELSLNGDEATIERVDIHNFHEDYTESKYISTSKKLNLGTFTYPSTITIDGKTYNVTTVGWFEDITSKCYLEEVVVPNGVVSMKKLEDSSTIHHMVIPASVTTLPGNIFEYIKNVTIDENNASYKLEDGWLLSKDGKTLYSSIGKTGKKITLPSTITNIEEFGLSNIDLDEYGIIVVPKSVKTIKDLYSDYTENIIFQFKSTKPPKIHGNQFSKNKKYCIM